METSIYCYILLYLFLKNYLQKLNKRLPPSPFLSFPIIGHLYLIKKPLHRTLAKLANKYGPILFFKFGSRPVVIVSSPSAAEECFTRNDITFANRPGLLAGKHLGYNYTTLVWASYGSHWRNLRRIASLELLLSHRLQMFHGIGADEVRSFHWWVIAGKRYYGEDKTELEEAKRFKQMVVETFQLSGATNIRDYVPVLKYGRANGLEKKPLVLQKKRTSSCKI
ncbi:hypothetical protein ACLB2K_014860 [Fragaria x ananassa]